MIERRIEVVNHTASKARVVVYPSAAGIAKGGFVGSSGRTPNEVSIWTSAAPPGALELA